MRVSVELVRGPLDGQVWSTELLPKLRIPMPPTDRPATILRGDPTPPADRMKVAVYRWSGELSTTGRHQFIFEGFE